MVIVLNKFTLFGAKSYTFADKGPKCKNSTFFKIVFMERHFFDRVEVVDATSQTKFGAILVLR